VDFFAPLVSFDDFMIEGFVIQILDDQGLTRFKDLADNACPAVTAWSMIFSSNTIESFHREEILL